MQQSIVNTPLIKWTGSKRPIAHKIVSYFPRDIETYYEPFLGGGSVFFQLLRSDANVKSFYLSDKNEALINIFKIVKNSPQELILSYKDNWECLQKDPQFFYEQREKYNKTQDPFIFYFLTRTCYNGTIRYNSKGEFNTSYHFNRPGMHPDKVEQVILYYYGLMEKRNITFSCNSFETIAPCNYEDVVYIDPPYTNTKALYFGYVDFESVKSWLDSLNCSWFMNINGVNSTDNEEIMDLEYTEKLLLHSGNSSFSRMKGKTVNVKEYFYYKYSNDYVPLNALAG